MVQKEVKKKTALYGIVAILSAVILITMVYSFGSIPGPISPQTPGTTSNPGGSGSTVITQILGANSSSGMKSFSSLEELTNYLANASQNQYFGGATNSFGAVPAPTTQSAGTYGVTTDYSTTNIQVAGVDEADTVKTDGQYIYTLSNSQASPYYFGYSTQAGSYLYIINANPQSPQVVSKIALDSSLMPVGLYVSSDSSKLVVIANKYNNNYNGVGIMAPSMIAPIYGYASTAINVYDISNKASPTLALNFTVTGNYFNSRLIGSYLYAVTSESAWVSNGAVPLPAVYKGGVAYEASPTSIYYADMNESSFYQFTSFYGINLQDLLQMPSNMTVLMSGASTMYVSPSNIYVAYPNWINGTDVTSIYRVKIDGLQLTFEAQGNVPGYVMDQYSMDENDGNLRVATNLYQYPIVMVPGVAIGGSVTSSGAPQQPTQTNNLYVLDQNLTVIGKLEGIGAGENLHAVRFMDDRAYMVTFIRTDPLFVIDLSNPQTPTVLGELTMPGYSDFLQPYDETHLIGIGKDAVAADQGNFAWYLGLRLALFDVSDVNHPVLVANYSIGDRGTTSEALNDPKAILFDKAKNLLVIPVDLAKVNQTLAAQYPSDVPAYGQPVWQGAYVFSLSPSNGFTLKGTVTHLNAALLDSQAQLSSPDNYYTTQNDWITRSLYIGNTLYTISNGEVKLNSLTDMSEIATVNLQ